MKFTKHFIDRYFERILQCKNSLNYSEAVSAVKSDIIEKQNNTQKYAFEYFIGNRIPEIKLPIGTGHRLVIRKDWAITVY
jgi:hypothetical protein|tara:strand:- start:36 stop:275 length:240 start_codon:yes stop_codon:yes gene_type:complete